jgi:ABC-type lipoprotein release transport system permease subunit
MIEKQRNILDFTLTALLRRKGKNAALLVSYTMVVALLASVMFLTHALRREANLVLQDSPDMVVQKLVAGHNDLIPLAYLDQIAAIMGVKAVSGRLWGYYYDSGIGANYTVMAPTDNPVVPGSIVIGEGIARTRKLAVGDLFPLRGANGQTKLYEVASLLSPASSLVAADLLLMAEGDFRGLFSVPDHLATDLVLTVGNPSELTTIVRKISEGLPDTRSIVKEDISRTYEAMFSWRSGILIVILASVVLSFLIFAWDKASGLSAEERYEIGILKALGWDTSDVLLMKFWEGVAISFSSLMTGVLLAYIHVFFTSSALLQPVLKGWSVLYPEFRLTPFVSPYQILTLFFLTVVPYTVATIIPAWHAATVDPDSVMRA